MPTKQPNILIFMCDHLQADVLRPGTGYIVPNMAAAVARGTLMNRAYTPNAICSPARASLMTGLLPHNHNMITVHHTAPDGLFDLRTDKPHFAQRLKRAGYHTCYVGKWHVDRSEKPGSFGWDVDLGGASDGFKEEEARLSSGGREFARELCLEAPEGYARQRFAGVLSEINPNMRMHAATNLGVKYIEGTKGSDTPFCCFVSLTEPHDPYVCSKASFDRYEGCEPPYPVSAADDLSDKPALYRKVRKVFDSLSDEGRRFARRCYFGTVTDIDDQFGRLMDALERSGRARDTVVIITTDHGDHLGAHGLFCKNAGAFDEVYNIPMLLAGPGIPAGQIRQARVGLQDLCQTIIGLAGAEPIDTPDSRSFLPALADPAADAAMNTGLAEYWGGRVYWTQRIVYKGDWKLVFNPFDVDELYNIADDPREMNNLAESPEHDGVMREMFRQMWSAAKKTGDTSLVNSNYPPLRTAKYGMDI